MPQWLKNLVMLVVLIAWLSVVGFSLYKGELPNAAVLGIPAAVVVALAPPIAAKRGRRRKPAPRDTDGEDVE